MPKVIGQDQKIAKEVTCRNCGAINEYYSKDVRLLYSGTDYSGGPDGARGFNCAECHSEIKTEVW
jgi:hypothetical protein